MATGHQLGAFAGYAVTDSELTPNPRGIYNPLANIGGVRHDGCNGLGSNQHTGRKSMFAWTEARNPLCFMIYPS